MRKLCLSTFFALSTLVLCAQKSHSPLDIKEAFFKDFKIDSTDVLDEVILKPNTLLGSKFQARNRTGSAYYLSSEDLKKHNYLDINRVLGEIPGVNVYEEDGFGLRPNISLRGTSPERSSKITLMEDGVLIAPAPYSAPAAYYFPNVARMQAVEVLKGSSQIQYGPFTTGGAINFVSTEVPTEFKVDLRANYGFFGTSNSMLQFGETIGELGYVVEYLKNRSNGFKDLDGPGGTGFDRDDMMAKFRYATGTDTKVRQLFELKLQYAEEDSDDTYLGLTQADFDVTPFRRYAGTQADNMRTVHRQIMLTHQVVFDEKFSINTTVYNNSFARNWYKLDRVVQNGSRIRIADLLDNPADYPLAFGYTTGLIDSPEDALLLKNNNRVYYARGIQTKFDYHFFTGDIFHDIEIGLRYHVDEEDRFQWVNGYRMLDGVMGLTSSGLPGTDSNRISMAQAVSAHFLYKLKFNNLTITPGIRYENVSLTRDDYGTSDINRVGVDLNITKNSFAQFIPGIGANYKFNENVSAFGGVHRGFSPAGFVEDQAPEESTNFELGTRFNFYRITGEIVGFYNNYSNMLGSDLAATGGIDGSLDLFNAGAVKVQGFELQLGYDFVKTDKFRLPINVAYTYTSTEFLSDFASPVGIWGNVQAGDEMPYIPNHQFNASIGFEYKKLQTNINARFRDEFRTVAGVGSILPNQKVESMFVVDASVSYQLTSKLSLTANSINLFDEVYTAARVPAGLRPGHPFGIYGGFRLQL